MTVRSDAPDRTTEGRPGPGGVIHDIGYRHHTGPRLGRRYIRRSLFVESARAAYGLGRTARARIVPMLLLAAMCLPAIVLVAGTVVTGADELIGDYTAYLLNTQIVVAIFVAAQAPANVSRDLRFGVTSLYFARPLERIDYVTAKFAAMTTAVFVLIATPLTILLLGALVAELPLSEQLPDYLRSLGGALLAALLLAGISLVIAAVTPRRGIGIAAIITVLLVLAGVQGATQVIASEQGADVLAGYLGLLSPFTLVDGVQSQLLGAETVLPVPPHGAAGGAIFAAVTLALILASFAALAWRYRRVSVS